jgi:hypothetical protein
MQIKLNETQIENLRQNVEHSEFYVLQHSETKQRRIKWNHKKSKVKDDYIENYGIYRNKTHWEKGEQGHHIIKLSHSGFPTNKDNIVPVDQYVHNRIHYAYDRLERDWMFEIKNEQKSDIGKENENFDEKVNIFKQNLEKEFDNDKKSEQHNTYSKEHKKKCQKLKIKHKNKVKKSDLIINM